jgi:acetyl esterase/lipase
MSTRAFVLALLSTAPCVDAGEAQDTKPRKSQAAAHLRLDHTVGDLLEHPAFAGFSRQLLPWEGRRSDPAMPLTSIGSLLPYHQHVNPAVVVSALNRMIDESNVGRTIVYDIYSEGEKRTEPSRERTGLFFLRGKPGAPFAIIAPGGGFEYVASLHEGFPYAVEISTRGYNAFVLRYRAGQGGTVATEDLAAAISYVFRHARSLDVATAGYSLWGSSAGARMVAAIGSHGVARFGGSDLAKPSAVVTLYTGHSEVASADPPTFVAVGEADGIAPPRIMERRVAALRNAGTRVEYHRYAGVGHGFGLGVGTSAEGWIADAIRFWTEQVQREATSEAAVAVTGAQR